MDSPRTSAYGSMRSDPAYCKDFVSRPIYHSNAIEGDMPSLAETYAIQWNDNSTIRNSPFYVGLRRFCKTLRKKWLFDGSL